MKQRITYVVKSPENFSPDQIIVQNDDHSDTPRFFLKGVDAAKEHRITLGLDELPEHLSESFQLWHEKHYRWASSAAYTATPPFTSRVSPGLHVFFTPLESTPEHAFYEDSDSLFRDDKSWWAWRKAIKLPILSERFSMATSLQYYSHVGPVADIVMGIAEIWCRDSDEYCFKIAKKLATAAYLDVDYDTISRAVVITAGWPDAPDPEGWSEAIDLPNKDATIEIGVLSHEANADPEDIQFGGFLTVLGQDATPKAARFQTPTRHYPLLSSSSPSSTPKLHPLTYTTSFTHPTGLHPTLTLSFPTKHLTPPNPTCKLHTHLTLPSYLFIDKYQFTDALFLASKNIKNLRSLAGVTDLEAPDWVIEEWGSAALFELAHPPTAEGTETETDTEPETTGAEWNVSIPLHLRYLPASTSSHTSVPVPWPVVFWACRADEGAKMAANPFDRVHLGYEALFGPKTRFMHVEPAVVGNGTGQLVEWINVPVLDTRKTGWVEAGTVGTVLVAFLGLCWVLFRKKGGVEKGKKKQ